MLLTPALLCRAPCRCAAARYARYVFFFTPPLPLDVYAVRQPLTPLLLPARYDSRQSASAQQREAPQHARGRAQASETAGGASAVAA